MFKGGSNHGKCVVQLQQIDGDVNIPTAVMSELIQTSAGGGI